MMCDPKMTKQEESCNTNKNSSSSSSLTNNKNSNRCLSFNLKTTKSAQDGPHYQRKYSLKCILYPSFYFNLFTPTNNNTNNNAHKNNNSNNSTTKTSNNTSVSVTYSSTILKYILTIFIFGLSMIGLTLLSSSNNGKAFAHYKFSNFFPKFAKNNFSRRFHYFNSDNDSEGDNSGDDALVTVTGEGTEVYQDEYDQTKIITKTIFPNHYFSNNDSSYYDPLEDTTSTTKNSMYYYYLNETDYNLLRNVTTQIGSFDPLPPSIFVSTTQPLALAMVGANGNVNININTFSFSFHDDHDHSTTTTNTYNQKLRKMIKPKRFIPVLEARGSSDRDIDKNEHGHRRDTIPIATAIDSYSHNNNNNNDEEGKDKVHSAVLQFLEEDNGRNLYAIQSNLALKEYLRNVAHGIVVRINPGTLSPLSQKKCDDMLRELSKENGLVILSHPDVSSTLGAKDSLVKIRNLKCGMEDTEVYYTPESFHEGFRRRISYEPRVIKQNRGCQGEGVWIVKLKDESQYCTKGKELQERDCIIPLDAELELMEAFDNHIEYHTVQEFLDFCSYGRSSIKDDENGPVWTTKSNGKYFDGGLEAGAMVVDQRFLPRIVEGEVRCLMVGSELVEIVHKKPREGGLSATLESGATYTKYPPDHPKFEKLVKNFKEDVPRIMESFGMSDQPLPLLWTVDYIYGDTDDDLYAGEINCSCPGITKQLHIAPTIAKVAFESVFADR